ncbi:MAG TPA: AbrB/MazE/SpoVT family DNA-binding domain-containing protein [Verrucomicrobiae bacterium]
MSATAVREKRETTIPADVAEAAGIHPGDQVDWRFEGGEIRVRKIVMEQPETLGMTDIDPVTLLPKAGTITRESIVAAIRADRNGKS